MYICMYTTLFMHIKYECTQNDAIVTLATCGHQRRVWVSFSHSLRTLCRAPWHSLMWLMVATAIPEGYTPRQVHRGECIPSARHLPHYKVINALERALGSMSMSWWAPEEEEGPVSCTWAVPTHSTVARTPTTCLYSWVQTYIHIRCTYEKCHPLIH